MTKISTRDARQIARYAVNRDPFKTHGALEGRETLGRWDSGRLPSEYVESFLTADYAVYSYATPIAWHVPDFGWVMPETRYSLTTTRHQSTVSYALSLGMIRPVVAA
ncbi:hypothetical protein [Nocardioides sp.]|uniref:hypothetical protein n=1 Tax=Nocardioides sp. TaxID=35761 RepID=UPI002CA2D569|nr:hypothetical protein [Nocardioides sp.]HSX68447.1 hypothetical protein [Nocardioides sp.]